jgi:DNA-binding Xre family transcriptional regulator
MTTDLNAQHLGSDLDDFLSEQGLLAETEAVATKRVIAWQLEQAMQARGLSKAALAKQMHTSRAAVDRLLDPNSPSVTLLTLERAAQVLGRRLVVSLT